MYDIFISFSAPNSTDFRLLKEYKLKVNCLIKIRNIYIHLIKFCIISVCMAIENHG